MTELSEKTLLDLEKIVPEYHIRNITKSILGALPGPKMLRGGGRGANKEGDTWAKEVGEG
jgi:hypothetical protein